MAAKKSFLLRINPTLYEVYERWAADEFRSVNSHLEFVLRDAAIHAGRLPIARNRMNNDPEANDDDNEGTNKED